jgi:hypothetical protein
LHVAPLSEAPVTLDNGGGFSLRLSAAGKRIGARLSALDPHRAPIAFRRPEATTEQPRSSSEKHWFA